MRQTVNNVNMGPVLEAVNRTYMLREGIKNDVRSHGGIFGFKR
jgi:hypothetical protein